MEYELWKAFWNPSRDLVSRQTISWTAQLKKAAYRDEQSEGRAQQLCKTVEHLPVSPKVLKKWEKVLSVGISLLPRPWIEARKVSRTQSLSHKKIWKKEFALKIVEGEEKSIILPPFLNFPLWQWAVSFPAKASCYSWHAWCQLEEQMAPWFISNCSLSQTAQIALIASQYEQRTEHSACPSRESLRRLIIICIWQVSRELIRTLGGVGVEGAQYKKMPELYRSQKIPNKLFGFQPLPCH